MQAFPVIYAQNVAESVEFYTRRLGFEEIYRLPEEGEPGYVGLCLGESRLGIVAASYPADMIGVRAGTEPRFELFVYVPDVDALVGTLREAGATVLRPPEDMPWGERLAYVADPEGNPIALAMSSTT